MFNYRSFVPEEYYYSRPRYCNKPIHKIPHYIEPTPIYPEEKFEEHPRIKKIICTPPPTPVDVNQFIQNERNNFPSMEEISEMNPEEIQANLLRELTIAMIEQIQRTGKLEDDYDDLKDRIEVLEDAVFGVEPTYKD